MSDKKNTVEEVLKIFKNGWNKQVILYGPPGTSKTYSAIEIAARFLVNAKVKEENEYKDKLKDAIGKKAEDIHSICEKYLENESNFKVIQFHPSYSYEDFVRGIVVKTKDLSGKELSIPSYEVERKIIETFGEDASEENPKVLVIDEINRAPLGLVLGELIYGLEYRGKAVSTPYVIKNDSREIPLKISEHLYIIGTMNTADRSIGSIDYAVRRRFAFVPVLPDSSVIKSTWNVESVGETAETLFQKLMDEKEGIFQKDLLEDESIDVNDIKIGHTYFLGKGKDTTMNDAEAEKDYLKYRIEYQIKPVYEEYIKDGLIKKEGLKIFDDKVESIL